MGLSAHADQVTAATPATETVANVQGSSAADQLKQLTTNLSTDTAVNSSQASANPKPSAAAAQTSSADSRLNSQGSPVASSSASSNAASAAPANSAASTAKQSSQAAQNPEVNVNDWTYTRQSDGIVLNGFNGHIVNGKIVVPNSYDFSQAGIISAGQKVYLGRYFGNFNGINSIHRLYGSEASEFMISHDGDGKVYAYNPYEKINGINPSKDWGDAFNGTPYKIIDLTNLNVSGVKIMSQMFAWSMAEKIIGLDGWDTSDVTSMGSMFQNDQHLQSVGDLSHWNVSNVRNMVSMFELASSLKTPGDLSSWNVSNVQNMAHMFAYATSLTSLGNLSNWKLSNVERTDMMFMQNWNLQNLGDLSGWDMSKDQDMSHMFDGAASLVNLGNLGKWHTGNVTNMEAMFLNAKSLQNIGDLSAWDTGKVTSMKDMFNTAQSLKDLGNLDQWNTGKVTSMENMFQNTKSLQNIGDLSNWNTGKVASMGHMFDNASSLVNLGDLSNWNTANVTDMQYLFNNDQKLQYVGLLNHWQTGKISNMDHMFFNNYSLDKLDLSNWDTSKVKSMIYTFASDNLNQSLQSLGDLSKWDVSNVTNFTGTFSHLAKVESLGNLANWKTGNAQDMRLMFYEMRKLKSLDVSGWDTSKVTTMFMMFMNDYELGSLTGLANWNVSNVTAANAMFCRTGLSSIDIHGWNLSKDRDTRWMFAYSLKPVVIDMRGVTLPTSTDFTLLSFYGYTPIVVYSNAGSKLFSLNSAEMHNYKDWVGNTTINVIGRQNTNYLTLHKKDPNAANGIAPQDLDDDTIATRPMYFVFTDQDDLIRQMQANTKKNDVNRLVAEKYGQNVHVSDDHFDSNNSLRHDFNKAATQLVADNYDLDLAGDAYSQKIIYQDPSGNVIKEASINGHLNDHGQATISRQDLLDAINANRPASFQVISGLPTTDLNINSTQPAPIIVKVQLANTIDPAAEIIYQTPDGKIVGRSTINGNIGETVALHLQVPAGYEAIGQLPTSYTFTDAEHQQLIILVKAKTAAPDQPVSPDQPTTPDQPATPSSPRHAAQAKAAALLNVQPAQHAQAAAQKADAQRLPQTGARQLGDLSLIGFSLMSISGILALSQRRKRNL